MIEFILGLMVVISFLFFYVKMAAVFAIGNYIHYATFMAARAYASSSTNLGTQNDNAQTVMTKMVQGRWKGLVKPSNGGTAIGPGQFAQEDAPQNYWNQGAAYSYVASFSLYPWNKTGELINLKLTSESSMPQEDSSDDTLKRMHSVEGGLKGLVPGMMEVVWDNGF